MYLGVALRAFPRYGPIPVRPIRNAIQRNSRPERQGRLVQHHRLQRVLPSLSDNQLRHDIPPRVLTHDVYSRAHGALSWFCAAEGHEEDEDGGRRYSCQVDEVLSRGTRLVVYVHLLHLFHHGVVRCCGKSFTGILCPRYSFDVLVRESQLFPTRVPFWSMFIAVLFPFIYILPSGFVYAYTAQSVSTFSFTGPSTLPPVSDCSFNSTYALGVDQPDIRKRRWCHDPRKTLHQHDLQSVLYTDDDGRHQFRPGSQVGPLYQVATASDVHG